MSTFSVSQESLRPERHLAANDFHAYYNAHQFLVDDAALRDARLNLILAVRQALANGLQLLGVSAPQAMAEKSAT